MRRARISAMLGVAAAVSVALLLASCTLVERVAKVPPPWAPGAAAQPPAVYYAAVDGLKVYSDASSRSKVVGALSLHEKVTRTRLERGYAYVESAQRDLKGWVTNAKLIWRLPEAGAPAAEEAQPEEPAAATGEKLPAPAAPGAAPAAAAPLPGAAPAAAEQPPEAAPVPAAPPRPKATPGGVAPSIFNPY